MSNEFTVVNSNGWVSNPTKSLHYARRLAKESLVGTGQGVIAIIYKNGEEYETITDWHD